MLIVPVLQSCESLSIESGFSAERYEHMHGPPFIVMCAQKTPDFAPPAGVELSGLEDGQSSLEEPRMAAVSTDSEPQHSGVRQPSCTSLSITAGAC